MRRVHGCGQPKHKTEHGQQRADGCEWTTHDAYEERCQVNAQGIEAGSVVEP